MKKITFFFCLFILVFVSGCFDITQESTINEDGSGVIVNKTDMSGLLGMMKMMGGDDMNKKDDIIKDSIISLSFLKDSLPGLDEKEKALLEIATLNTILNTADEKLEIIFRFPYNEPADMQRVTGLLAKAWPKALESQIQALVPDEGAGNPLDLGGPGYKEAESNMENYFININENGKLSRKINKEKYEQLKDDRGMKALQEISQMGSPMTLQTIYNLPRPVIKAEGKGVKLSDDKKKVTISATIDDLFDDPSKFEYEIEY